MKLKTLCFVLVAWSITAGATPGNVTVYGCHNSKTAGHHCHAERASILGTKGGESYAQRSKRLDRECVGMHDSGECYGHVKKRR